MHDNTAVINAINYSFQTSKEKKNLSHPKSIKFAYVQQGKKQENIIFALQIT